MSIVIIGGGGREHAIAWKLAQSVGWDKVFTLPGNGGIPNSIAIDPIDFKAIEEFCKEKQIELIVVGPELPLTEGIVNHFEESESDIKVFGPDKTAAQLEGSKIWAKQFMQKYGVQTADFEAFQDTKEAYQKIADMKGNLVVKYDGLAGGKGVFVCDNAKAAKAAIKMLGEKYGEKTSFLIEEKIVGDEISIIGFTDGKHIQLLQASQDHKQLNEEDSGPNTGGMGAFSPVDFCDEALMQSIHEKIIQPTLKGIESEGLNYKGFIYFGLMIREKEPYLLEYNVRLGDPETEVLLPALKNDLKELILACFDGTLENQKLEFEEGYFVDVVQVSTGYPNKYETGFAVQGLYTLTDKDLVFHAGTVREKGIMRTNGGRVLNVVGNGKSLALAIENAYKLCEKVHFKGCYYRKDIGNRKSQT